MRHLESKGLWHAPAEGLPAPVGSFYRSLVAERGLSDSTIYLYRLFSERFLSYLRKNGSASSLAKLSANDVDRFLIFSGRQLSRKSMSMVGAVLRALLRHLFQIGVLDRDLSPCVVLPRFYALERLPCALPWPTVRSLLRVPEATNPAGLRDRAMLALLVTYGVRPGEVARLRLEDIDWRRGAIRFERSKRGRALSFPLTAEVGRALEAYLRRGRPATRAREVFVRCLAPHHGLNRGSVISTRVALYLDKAHISARKRGAGVIRHSLAVHLLRKGHPLKTITDVLGHRDPGVAYHYTKLAVEDLRDVALDAPVGGR